ncbi:hypothetical protein COLO4_04247 [Corchorus olitorius]|uniref:Uncharacterized protein n=1 Tax=Corchorus olitorius TaxID=93759 RepID=A0A1R3KUU3_9ROSI|nr:hypothetical protein COLO4_04247 [Corchorus olitorius]
MARITSYSHYIMSRAYRHPYRPIPTFKPLQTRKVIKGGAEGIEVNGGGLFGGLEWDV